MIIYSLAVFLSSFLSFSLQLMVGKIILPWFGGSSSIWSTLLFYFISFLLIGYLYVFYLTKLNFKKQQSTHLTVLKFVAFYLLSTLYVFHKLFPSSPKIVASLSSNPTIQIIALVTLTVGIPFFLLSTTSTLLQSWYSRSHANKSPYFLYNISNTGSLLGLLSYPFMIEPYLTLKQQEITWASLFILLLAFLFYITLSTRPKNNITAKAKDYSISKTNLFIWTTLSGISNLSLLATSTIITQAVTPTPFLWLFPLCLFLLSYILAFSGKWYQRGYYLGILTFSIILLLAEMNSYIKIESYWLKTALIVFIQFLINFICHSELFISKPKPEKLTYFYLFISLGGVLGSIFCALLAPLMFKDFWEFPISLIFSIFLYVVITTLNSNTWQQITIHLFVGTAAIFLIILSVANSNKYTFGANIKIIHSQRNFYGTIKVAEENLGQGSATQKTLYNGKISHGLQKFNAPDTRTPTSYYSPQGGIGQLITKFITEKPNKPLRIGVVGLGTGGLAGYCKNNDYYRFYEINPQVIVTNEKHFTFIKNCKESGGMVDIVLGDARLSLQNESISTPQNFDILAVDAFTDDAIPVHLLTSEAITLYFKHLNSTGILAIHISNRHLNLDLALNAIAKQNRYFVYPHNTGSSYWYFLSKTSSTVLPFYQIATDSATIKPWTDDFNNLFQVLK